MDIDISKAKQKYQKDLSLILSKTKEELDRVESKIKNPIDDTSVSNTTTYSSSKIDTEYAKLTDLHTHDNKDVLDLLTENDEGKLQYNGTTIGGEGGASTADAVSYVNTTVGSNNVEEALNKLIADYYYVAPSITSFTASPTGGVFEVGTTVTAPIIFNWAYNKNITTQTLTGCVLTDNAVRTVSYDTDITDNKTFTLTCSDGTNNASASKTYTFVNATYYGVMSSGSVTPVSILANCTKEVRTKSDITKKFTCNKQTIVFASPWKLKSIINQNNYEVISAFVESTMMINGATYYVYELANVTISDFAYSFKY